jgi:flagellin
MRSQIRGMNQASRNSQDGISLIQTAEGYMDTITGMLQRTRVLMVQAANDTYSVENRRTIFNEIAQLSEEIGRVWDNATFNGQPLFYGNTGTDLPASGGIAGPTGSGTGTTGVLAEGTFSLQVGANSTDYLAINVAAVVRRFQMELTGALYLTRIELPVAPDDAFTGEAIRGLLDGVDIFINEATNLRAALGAYQNRLEFTIENLDIASENLSASESRIRDADMAAEMMALTQANVLQQAATAMLAQANQSPQSILQLLQ